MGILDEFFKGKKIHFLKPKKEKRPKSYSKNAWSFRKRHKPTAAQELFWLIVWGE